MVVAVLSTAAYVALDTVDTDTAALRREATVSRLETLRRAIVGRTDLAQNGAPAVSGYVADVGRLPPCVAALLERAPSCDWDGDGAAETLDVPVYGQLGDLVDPDRSDFDGRVLDLLAYGWRGPYVTATPDGFVDAFGNAGAAPDYGWDLAFTPATGTPNELEIRSLGRDRAAEETVDEPSEEGYDPEGYGADVYMAPIVETDFRVDLGGTMIETETFVNTGPAVRVCLALLEPDPDDPTADPAVTILEATPPPVPDPGGRAAEIPDGTVTPQTLTVRATIGTGEALSIGRRLIVLYDATAAGDANDCSLVSGATAIDTLEAAGVLQASVPILVSARMSTATVTVPVPNF